MDPCKLVRHPQRWSFTSLLVLSVLGISAPASAEPRFQGLIRGGLATTGNALGLSKASKTNAPGTLGSIGTFIAAGATSQDGSYPPGTTSDWRANASEGTLSLPSERRVAYAELVWGGSYAYGGEDVSAHLDSSVALSYGGEMATITPDPKTALTLAVNKDLVNLSYYTRSADVTSFVAAHGGGVYRVAGVPGTQADSTDSYNAAGWSLLVVWEDEAEPFRWVALRTDGGYVDEEVTVTHEYGGFCLPPSRPVEGRVVAVAIEGDANQSGDSLRIGHGTSFAALSSTNNPAQNFFASQIDDQNGSVDTIGSFGTRNHDAHSGVNIIGSRQGWDLAVAKVASADVSGLMGSTALALRAQTIGDVYILGATGVELSINGPRFVVAGSSSLSEAQIEVGGATRLELRLDNRTGSSDATHVVLRLPLPSGVEVQSLSIERASESPKQVEVSNTQLTAGVDLGTVSLGSELLAKLELQASRPGRFALHPAWSSELAVCPDVQSRFETHGESITLDVRAPLDAAIVQDASAVETDGAPRDGSGESRADGGATHAVDSGTAAMVDVDAGKRAGEADRDASGAAMGAATGGRTGCGITGPGTPKSTFPIMVLMAVCASRRRRALP